MNMLEPLCIDLLYIREQAFCSYMVSLVMNYVSPQLTAEYLTGVDIRVPHAKKTC